MGISHPYAIRTEQREVTLLFADLRGFTELAASLEVVPLVCELQGHVMDCLSEAVLEHHGQIVDYFGDGLMAMWNAPHDQPAHRELGCRAALQMLETLPSVADDWAGAIQSELRLGIGLHTGEVQTGNAGSARQAKYGPRGPNVHLASRVESATKPLRQPLLATHTTVQGLTDTFAVRRVCRAQMPGLHQPTDLFAVRRTTHDAQVADAWRLYDQALRYFEQEQMREAADALGSIDSRIQEVPWRFLSAEVERELGRQRRRRSTDGLGAGARGVIMLPTK